MENPINFAMPKLSPKRIAPSAQRGRRGLWHREAGVRCVKSFIVPVVVVVVAVRKRIDRLQALLRPELPQPEVWFRPFRR